MRFGTVIAVASLLFSAICAAQVTDVDKKMEGGNLLGIDQFDQIVQYLLIPVSNAREFRCQGDSLFNLVSAKYTPGKPSQWQKINASIDFPFIQLASNQASTLSDDELLCYRCCFEKVNRKDCGIFTSKYGVQSWAPNCPKSR